MGAFSWWSQFDITDKYNFWIDIINRSYRIIFDFQLNKPRVRCLIIRKFGFLFMGKNIILNKYISLFENSKEFKLEYRIMQ